ncbi:MAG: LPS export ABC transporter periplasmic protein LptC [Nitrospirae bacterium]|nr:LPS export ABC transporter periplasmic protein LptC [Nitrospirota bacterium]
MKLTAMPYIMAIIIGLLLLIFITVLFKGKSVDQQGGALEIVSLGGLSQSITDFHIFRLNGEKLDMEIKAREAKIFEGEDDASIRGIEITYNPQRKSPVKLYADKGTFNIDKNTLYLEKEDNAVDIKIGSNVTIKADSLRWLEESKEVRSPGKVYLKGDNFNLEGEGFVARIDNDEYELKKNVRATMW